MADVKARCWPHDLPFVDFADGETIRGFSPQTKAGDFKFCDESGKGTTDPAAVRTMQFMCLGDGAAKRSYCGSIQVRQGEKPSANRVWGWDGNFEHPTLTPSINCTGCWHGWLQNGIFRSC